MIHRLMRYVFAMVFAGLAACLWFYVYRAIGAGYVMRPRGNAWWRETRYYDRDSEVFRFWLTVGMWGVLGLLASFAAVRSLMTDEIAN